jgi:hypothetical protein
MTSVRVRPQHVKLSLPDDATASFLDSLQYSIDVFESVVASTFQPSLFLLCTQCHLGLLWLRLAFIVLLTAVSRALVTFGLRLRSFWLRVRSCFRFRKHPPESQSESLAGTSSAAFSPRSPRCFPGVSSCTSYIPEVLRVQTP